MKKLLAIIGIIAIGFSIPFQAFADAIDAGATNHSGAIGIGFGDVGAGRDYMCQGFVMSDYNQITAVGFYVNSKDGDANIGYKVWIDNSDSTSQPTGSVGVGIGGATEITNATLNTSGLTKYTLTSTVDVTIGNKYVVCFAPWNTTTHVFASSYHDFVSSTGNPYAPASFSGAKRKHGDTAYTTWTDPDAGNDDIIFDIYGQNSVLMSKLTIQSGQAVIQSGSIIIK